MSQREGASSFIGDIPTNYDTGLGPNIFTGYAGDLAQRVAACRPQRVLELAAGTGILTRALRNSLPASAGLTATDLNGPMLDVARKKFAATEQIEFAVADATALDFADGSFDTIACQFGIMFFPDKPKHYREARRILRRRGRYLFNVWGALAVNPFARIAHESIALHFPTNPPQFYRTPFSYHDPDVVTAHLKEAGFSSIAAHTVKIESRIAKIAGFARGLVYGNPVIQEIFARGSTHPDAVVQSIDTALRREFGPEPARMPLEALVFEASC